MSRCNLTPCLVATVQAWRQFFVGRIAFIFPNYWCSLVRSRRPYSCIRFLHREFQLNPCGQSLLQL